MPVPDESGKVRVIRELMEGRHVQENFRALFESYYPGVRGFFLRRGFPPEDALDLAQEVFVAVHTGIGSLHDADAFVGWLFAIARHIAARQMQRVHRAALVAVSSDSEAEIASPERSPLRTVLDREKADVVRAAIEELPERMRQCLRARVIEDLNYREIAERLGISENTVAVQVHRAIRTMRSRLKAFFDAGALREDL
jgi:RNA polymerase sigma-70 factor, ECF subfamily